MIYYYAYGNLVVSMVHHKNQSKNLPKLTPIIAASVMVVTSIIGPSATYADQFESKIKALEAQKAESQATANQLGQQANGIQGEIDGLRNQIAAIQAQIDINIERYNSLVKQIEDAQAKLEEQKSLLSANIRSMYIEGDISPLEMIASSKNLGDFVDKQEYRDRIKDSISTTMDEIEDLKIQLDEQKREVTRILDEQKTLRGSLDQAENSAAAKLNEVNQDKAAFDSQVKAQSQEIASLRAQQRAANLSAFGGGTFVASGNGGGGYPYNNVGYPCWGGGGCVDPWGLYKRECVSYTAFKVQQSGKRMPYFGGRGNARQWPSTASAFGIESGSTPRAESVAISYAGPYGHAMWVEAVLPDGRIHISEYNFGVDGRYSERIVSPAGLTFIYF